MGQLYENKETGTRTTSGPFVIAEPAGCGRGDKKEVKREEKWWRGKKKGKHEADPQVKQSSNPRTRSTKAERRL